MQPTRVKILIFLKKLLPEGFYFNLYKSYRSVRMFLDPYYRKRQTFFEGKGLHYFQVDDCKMAIYLRRDNGYTADVIYRDKASEPDILRLIRSLLTKDSVFVDAGANIGQHSLFSSFYCKHVYSFEPIASLFQQFQQSIRENSAFSISAFNFALGSSTSTVPIYSNKNNRGESSIAVAANRKFLQDVKVVRLDEVYEKMGTGQIHVIKIDVEGFEFEVLKGAEGIIDRWHPSFVIEFSPYLYNAIDATISNKIFDFLFAKGYTVYDVDKGLKRELITKENVGRFITDTYQTNILCLYENK